MLPAMFLKSKLALFHHSCINLLSTFGAPLAFRISPSLYAEPLKKKKRIDPAVIKAREERRRKRLEKQIRRLEKNAQQFKPIEECEVPLEIMKDIARVRDVKPQDIHKITLMFKYWADYKYKLHMKDAHIIDKLLYSQQLALDQLKFESMELYRYAIEVDASLFPLSSAGPTETPALPEYNSPDGEFVDASKKWDY